LQKLHISQKNPSSHKISEPCSKCD